MRSRSSVQPSDLGPAAEWVEVGLLKPWRENPRKNDASVPKVIASIRRFGFGAPLLVQRSTNEVIAGHTRLKAAIDLGLREVPVRYMDLTDAEAHALAIADNKLPENSEWDEEKLAAILRSGEIQIDEALGFQESDLKILLQQPSIIPPGDEVIPDKPKKPTTKIGDVYLLGEHRVACSDCRVAALWEAFGQLAMVWTDPPYGVAYKGSATKTRIAIENDDLSRNQLELLLKATLELAVKHVRPGGALYVAGPDKPDLAAVFLAAGKGLFRQTLIWEKDRIGFGRSDYQNEHEPIYYGWTAGKHFWFSDRKQSTILRFDRPQKSDQHPTMKPPPLVVYCLENSSQRGDQIGDFYLGSGTTLIACQQSQRVCVGAEIDPGYVDVIVERWRQMTGQTPELQAGSPSLKGRRKAS